MERIDGPTPRGGVYSEVYYMNDGYNIVSKDKATVVVVRECDRNGGIIAETWGTISVSV